MFARRSTVHKIVLDANVLVSAVFGGVPGRAVNRAFREEVWISETVKVELLGLGKKLRSRLTLDQTIRWHRAILPLIGKMRQAEIRKNVVLSRDPADDEYLSLSLAAGADFLVTGDRDLLGLSKEELRRVGLGSLSIVTPKEFLEEIGG